MFLYFFRIGWFTFGGGFSIIAQMHKDFVEKEKLVTEEELIDHTSIGRSLPGLMVANVSYLFGSALGGPVAGIASIAGIILPPIIMLVVITYFYTAFQDNVYVARALMGVRAAVVPIIGVAAIRLWKGAMTSKVAYALLAAALVLSLFTRVGIIYIIVGGAVAGIIISEVVRRGTP
ncbi:MAG: chromate transporter [Christensenellales bacterium]